MPRWAFELTPRVVCRLARLSCAATGCADPRPQPDHRLPSAAAVCGPGRGGRACPAAASSASRSATSPTSTAARSGSRRCRAARLDRGDPAARPIAGTAMSHDFRSYARLPGVAPGVPLLGPAIANPVRHASWVSSLARAPARGLGIVTAHRYPYTACAQRSLSELSRRSRACSQRARVGRDCARSLTPAVGDRAPGRAAVSPDRAQLGHLRRRSRRQQHVRDRPVGPGHAVRAAARRASTASTSTSERTRSTRRSRSSAARARRPAAAVRAGPVPPCAGDRSQLCRVQMRASAADAREGVGGRGRGRRAPRAGDQQGQPRGTGRAADRAGTARRRCSGCCRRRWPRPRA